MKFAHGFVGCDAVQGDSSEGGTTAHLHEALVCILVVAALACSCIERSEVIYAPALEERAARGPAETKTAPAEQWILSSISRKLESVLRERVVHITADARPRVYRETWGEEARHVDVFFSDYAVRIPMEEIAGYPWESVEEQYETGHLGPILLRNGWQVWLGYIERADAISHDLSISVRETCGQLAVSGDDNRDRVVRRLCDQFRKGFTFEGDLQVFRRLWHSSFEVQNPMQLSVREALGTLFLADLKRLMAPPTAEEHVAEVQTLQMEGFEFGDETSEEGFSAELFDERNHVTVFFLPPMAPGMALDEELRQKVLASVQRHKRWTPGLEMLRKAEEVQQLPDLDNRREVATLLLFSSLQFSDHKSRAASMLVKLYPPDDPQHDDVVAIVNAMIGGE